MMQLPKKFSGTSDIVTPLNMMRDAIQARTILPGTNYGVDYLPNGVRLHIAPQAQATSLAVRPYVLISVRANYLICRSFNLSTGAVGTENVNVAKCWPAQLRSWASYPTDSAEWSTYAGPTITPFEIDGVQYGTVIFETESIWAVNHRERFNVRRTAVYTAAPTFFNSSSEVRRIGMEFTEMIVPAYTARSENYRGDIIWVMDVGETVLYEPAHEYNIKIDGTTGVVLDESDPAETLHITNAELSVTKMEMNPRMWLPVEREIDVCELVEGTADRVVISVRGSAAHELEDDEA